MKTDDLINALSADAGNAPPPLTRVFALAAVVGLAYAVALYVAGLGLRWDFAAAIQTLRYPLKILIVAVLAIGAWRLVTHLARPGSAIPVGAAVASVGLLAAAVAFEATTLPSDQWAAAMIGDNAAKCVASIPLLGFGALGAGLFALRRGAPTRPVLSGAAAGLLAGAVGAVLYATHCPDDSPFFVAVWYTIAIGLMAGLGAAGGRFLLKW